ncbi:hypothetical protein CAPTEDRAFT_217687 [Capitella teleta]|uniref:Neurotransmitter-gated ion-channel ligand-binding domain-containing protein n=1 Tax=Capitella teleta TaxID=283909 RepID=X2AMJ3_CAPTE|nr:hypothetical protein CAPTEDRAFT_217687 [Capitella teleta]|eukprot:ELU00305.1 hypothetical protein CAPTEDRAFT_217687 [Capitella teleta]
MKQLTILAQCCVIALISDGFNIQELYLNRWTPSRGICSKASWQPNVWTDYRLEWFAFDNNLHSVRVLPSDIWIPDLRLYNSLDAQTRPGHNFVVVTNDGTLDYIFPVNHRVRCPVEGNIVTCTLKVGSWTYSGAVLNLTSKDVDLSSYVARNDFELVTATVEREILQYKCCPEPYISLKYVITLEKQR